MPAPSVLVIVADGFEEIEAITPVDILRRAGASVTVAALAGMHVTGRCGLTVHADASLSDTEAASYDCILVPGGPGVSKLRADPRVAAALRRHAEAGGWIAAICAAPLVLNDAGLLGLRRFTAHFSAAGELPGAHLDERVVVDGRLITSRGAGTALEFAIAVVERLFSSEKAAEVAKSISA